jgi:catechol 2,3-dioxygenase-like lactoylglutathione lyase family enzyme
MSNSSPNPIKPLGIGEVALRVADLRRSIAFYCDMLGFTLIRVLFNSIAFLRVADGVEGHTQVIGLFGGDLQAGGDGETRDGLESSALDPSSLRHRDFAQRIRESASTSDDAQTRSSHHGARLDRLAIDLCVRPGQQHCRVCVLR